MRSRDRKLQKRPIAGKNKLLEINHILPLGPLPKVKCQRRNEHKGKWKHSHRTEHREKARKQKQAENISRKSAHSVQRKGWF